MLVLSNIVTTLKRVIAARTSRPTWAQPLYGLTRLSLRHFLIYIIRHALVTRSVKLVILTPLESQGNQRHLTFLLCAFLIYVSWRCSQIIHGIPFSPNVKHIRAKTTFLESVIVFPSHGVQLETHRGPFTPLFVSRRFIPIVYIHDVIINEALHRWNVRYYLALIVDVPGENRELAVAFEVSYFHTYGNVSEIYTSKRIPYLISQSW